MQDTHFEPSIIHEDEYLLVVDKPAGITVHAGGVRDDEQTVLDGIRDKIYDPESDRPGVVHRLDKNTSGVLVVAKDPGTKSFLQQQFQQRKVKKHYIAAVQGVPDPKHARIDVPVGRHPKNPLKRAVRPNGRPAITEYRARKIANDMSLLDVYPGTGRTHQIRVHLDYIGHPVLGDVLYDASHPKLNRHFLHAAELTFIHPDTHRHTTYAADTPTELRWKELGW